MVAPPVTFPPTETGSTVTVPFAEFTKAQTPLCITALYLVVTVRLVVVCVDVVFAISIGVIQLSVEYCHFKTAPVCPESVNVVLLIPEQTDAEPAMLPPTETG